MHGKELVTELRFEGANADELSKLRVSGAARVEGDRILIHPGESLIRGLPQNIDGRISVGSFKTSLHRDAIYKGRSPSSQRRRSKPVPPEYRIEVQQLLQGIPVNRFSTRYVIGECPTWIQQDTIRVENNNGDNVVILVDGQNAVGGACTNDFTARATTTAGIPNLRSGQCNSEIAVFSAVNAMSFETPVTTWSPASEFHTVVLRNVIDVPVSVWIAVAGTDREPRREVERARGDVAIANNLYSDNKVGVRFVATFTDVSGNSKQVRTIGDGCHQVGVLQASDVYTKGQLNVYYIDGQVPQGNGVNCARLGDDGNVNYVASAANEVTFSHELGHAFGLRPSLAGGHVNSNSHFGTNNIMWAGGTGTRDHFSLGQAFRMNTQADNAGGTMLIKNGLRAGPGRECGPLTVSNLCPELHLDWERPPPAP